MSLLYIRDKNGNLVPVPYLAGSSVTKENIVKALGYAPADEEDVSILLDALDTVEIVIPSININDGVYEYGTFTSGTGAENDSMTPITISIRSANYIPVEGGRAIASYYDKAEWNKNNNGVQLKLVQYDANKNILLGKTSDFNPYVVTGSPTFTLEAETAFIRFAFNKWSEITTPLEDIKIAIYYAEDAQKAFVPHDPTVVEEKVFNPSAISSLRGKKIVYDGDSIAESRTSGTAANGGGYAKLIADKVGGIYVNNAVGGSLLASATGKRSVVDELENLPKDGDLYCFQAGINDYWGNTALGSCTLNDFTGVLDKTTICGALETIFRYCLTNFVGKPICFVITHKVQNIAYSANSNGKTFKDYRDAMVQICEKYSIPYYDAFSESGLNGWNDAQSNAYLTANSTGTADGTHPNEEGYKRYYVPQLLALFRSVVTQ